MGKHLSVRKGSLPIFRFVVIHGVTYRKRLDYWEKIKCRICGMQFSLSDDAAFVERGTDIPYIKCPICKRLVQAVTYMKD